MKDDMWNISEETEDDEKSAWIVTYSDLITLMLTFFILLYSMSNLELEKFRQSMQSIQQSLRGTADIEYLPPAETDDQEELPADAEQSAKDQFMQIQRGIMAEIRAFIEKRGLNESIQVSLENGNIVIRVMDKVFFASGEAELNQEAFPIMSDIYEIFDNYPEFNIDIAGHTDDRPINTYRFPSNWELSTGRATRVLRYFLNGGMPPDRLTATGYAEIMPLQPNTSPKNQALNRRVEFILKKDFTTLE